MSEGNCWMVEPFRRGVECGWRMVCESRDLPVISATTTSPIRSRARWCGANAGRAWGQCSVGAGQRARRHPSLQEDLHLGKDIGQHLMARAGPKLGSSCLPVQALDLVCQHNPTHGNISGQGNLKRVPLDLTGYGTAQRQAGHTVVGCGTEHQGRSTARLLMPRLGRKANPHYVTAVWNIAGSCTLAYHTSAPWADPYPVPCVGSQALSAPPWRPSHTFACARRLRHLREISR